MTSIRILGPIEAWAQHRRLDLGGRRQLALFAFLVLHANRAVSRDALIDAVWGSDRSSSDNRLSMAIARLRKTLEPLNSGGVSPLRTVSGGYMLAIAPGELDAVAFADGVSAGRRALQAGDPSLASELAGEALTLWRGPALAEVAFEDFAQGELRRLEETRLEALEIRLEADLELGRHAQLVGELEGLAAEHPARERVASQLMLALYRCGRQGDALEVYQRTRAHLATELGLEPGPALKALQAQILEQAPALALGDESAGAVASSTRARTPPVPLPATPTIGREREVAEVCGLLAETDARLVTLTGPGGVGKTRLALATAHAAAASFEDGVAWVELAGVTRPDDVAPTIVRAVALTPVPGETPRDALIRYLTGKRLLLVIDNFEHVIDAAEPVGELVSASDRLKVLVTSREALDLGAEHRVPVGPLALPAISEQMSAADLQSTAATALFVDAARRRDCHVAITDAHAPHVARICARLDGLPLALELAAARTDVLGIDELATRLASIAELGTGPRDAPARQRTLSATIDWSYHLLDGHQQAAFARFAVFVGGATLESAQEVTGAAENVLAALIAKSLLERREQTPGSSRLVMLETVRQYAADRLAHTAEQDTIRRRHAEWYLRLVEETVPHLGTHHERTALAVLDQEINNIDAALRWALAAAPLIALRLAGHLGDYWRIRADSDAPSFLNAALSAAGPRAPAQDRARAHMRRAWLPHGQHELSRDAAAQALTLYRATGDDTGISHALGTLAHFDWRRGERELARESARAACRHAEMAGDEAARGAALADYAILLAPGERVAVLEEAAELLTRRGDYRQLARAYLNAAYADLIENRAAQATRLLEIALPAAQEVDDPVTAMFVWGNLGLAHLFSGDLEASREAFEHQMSLSLGHVFRHGTNEGLAGLAAISTQEDQLERAAQLLGAARALGYPPASDHPIYDRLERSYFAPARARYGTIAWRHAEQAGEEFDYSEAISYALEQPTHAESPGSTRARTQ